MGELRLVESLEVSEMRVDQRVIGEQPPGAKCAVVAAGMSAGPIEFELAEGAVIVLGMAPR